MPVRDSLGKECQITPPRRVIPERNGQTYDAVYIVGNDRLWTYVWENSVEIAVKELVSADGSISIKWPWMYRKPLVGELKVVGQLKTADGTMLDPVNLVTDINDAYSSDIEPGTGVKVSYMVFPAEGCWHVMASTGSETIKFVTMVKKAENGKGS